MLTDVPASDIGDPMLPPVVDAEPAPSSRSQRDELVHREGVAWTNMVRSAVGESPPNRADDVELKALAAWQATVSPGGPTAGSDPAAVSELFERRLRRDGLTPDTARVVVGAERPIVEPQPWWWLSYQEVVDAYRSPERKASSAHAESDEDWLRNLTAELPEDCDRLVPFAHLLWPAARRIWLRLADQLPEQVAELTVTAIGDLQRHLLTRLSAAAAPALSHLMWEGVPFGQQFTARVGPDPGREPDSRRQRYAAFCRRLTADELTGALTDFPVLGGLLGTLAALWTEAVSELLVRVHGDRAVLAAEMGAPPDGRLRHIHLAAGDTHNGGRTVAVLEFEVGYPGASGTPATAEDGWCVVYKPRSVALEGLLHQLVTTLSDLDPDAPLRAPKVMVRHDAGGDYGYAEYITGRPCRDGDELRRFYRNAGRVLALLNCLGATDCHHENLIAAGDQLVLIDGETLFDTRPADAVRLSSVIDTDVSGADPTSVLRVGMLPAWMWLEGQRTALDITALGAEPAPPAPRIGRGWRAINTDDMIRGATTAPTNHPTSLPTAPGQAAPLTGHLDDLIDGFAHCYLRLLEGRSTWLPRLLAAADGLDRRAVVRPTYVYASLLATSVEPAALRGATSRGMVLERLTRAYLGEDVAHLWPLVGAEQDALTRLDVPYFRAPVRGGRTVWPGGELPDESPQDALAATLARLDHLGDADLHFQLSLVRASVAASEFRMSFASPSLTTGPTVPARDAARVGHDCLGAVAATAVNVEGGATWMGLTLLPDGVRANVQAIGSGLYDGRMGLAVAAAIWATSDPAAVDQAQTMCVSALEPLLRLLASGDVAEVRRTLTAIGPGLAGTGGLLRGLAFLRGTGLLPDADLASAQDALIEALSPATLAADRRLDLIGGAAGLIAPLVALRSVALRSVALRSSAGVERIDELLRVAATTLVAGQDSATGGWFTLPGSAPLTGLAHGAAGIALALVEAGKALAESEYLDAAMRGLAYEAATFDPQAGNWPDYREGARSGFMMGWCAGAPGIALSRWRLLQLLPDANEASTWRDELARAARTTASAPASARDHLCCGNLGRVAVLRTVSRAGGDANAREAATESLIGSVLGRPDEPLPRSLLGADSRYLPMPGLFTGLPGAGLVLLDATPSTWVSALLL